MFSRVIVLGFSTVELLLNKNPMATIFLIVLTQYTA